MSNALSTTWPSGSANAGWPQEPTGMLMPGRIQGWPAGTQRAASPATTLLSQAVAWWDVEQYRDGDRFLRNRGTGGELLDLRLGSSIAANSNDPLYLAPADQGYVYLPGAAGNRLSVPDENALDITGDLDIRVRVAMDDWTPAALSCLAAKYQASNCSYGFYLRTDGTLAFVVSTSGITALDTTTTTRSTVATGITDGSVKWVRATFDADNGSGGRTYRYYTSDDGVSWSQLGSDVAVGGGTATIYVGAAGFSVGLESDGVTYPSAGRFYRAQVLDGIDGTTVLDIDCDAITSGSATSFEAGTYQTVTVNRSTSGRKAVAVPSRHKGGKPVMLFGTDDYLTIPDEAVWQHGLLNFLPGDSFTVLAVVRQWNTPQNNGSYIDKGSTSSDARWTLAASGTTLACQAFANDLTTSTSAVSPTTTNGALSTFAGTYDRNTRLARAYTNGSAGTAVVLGTNTLRSTNTLRIGRNATTGYQDFEFYQGAIFRRVLSTDELLLASREMTRRIA